MLQSFRPPIRGSLGTGAKQTADNTTPVAGGGKDIAGAGSSGMEGERRLETEATHESRFGGRESPDQIVDAAKAALVGAESLRKVAGAASGAADSAYSSLSTRASSSYFKPTPPLSYGNDITTGTVDPRTPSHALRALSRFAGSGRDAQDTAVKSDTQSPGNDDPFTDHSTTDAGLSSTPVTSKLESWRRGRDTGSSATRTERKPESNIPMGEPNATDPADATTAKPSVARVSKPVLPRPAPKMFGGLAADGETDDTSSENPAAHSGKGYATSAFPPAGRMRRAETESGAGRSGLEPFSKPTPKDDLVNDTSTLDERGRLRSRHDGLPRPHSPPRQSNAFDPSGLMVPGASYRAARTRSVSPLRGGLVTNDPRGVSPDMRQRSVSRGRQPGPQHYPPGYDPRMRSVSPGRVPYPWPHNPQYSGMIGAIPTGYSGGYPPGYTPQMPPNSVSLGGGQNPASGPPPSGRMEPLSRTFQMPENSMVLNGANTGHDTATDGTNYREWSGVAQSAQNGSRPYFVGHGGPYAYQRGVRLVGLVDHIGHIFE
ncbi:hypothetical protein M427DRAFT_208215 [Gonapodya prolifera JEL478]|uniref:Uncharacterized protein n=1 Tax=Gonapodya prolifera (strain JEL478) TaxID=1344416 RepID=A0A139AP94_GONPJ|nr:hypothetical protein M427DRAFT_208215 [Gonapodya prolifera JEL478]|eukprot:KXS18333.1 hypothetical protein M427DRAFT_208215 [Gonapodya prolifera JEL478]